VGIVKARNERAMDSESEKFVVDAQGRKTGVFIPMREYMRLMEDLHDLAVVAERREEKSISLQEMKSRLKKHGLL
jgi:hypothetical protein